MLNVALQKIVLQLSVMWHIVSHRDQIGVACYDAVDAYIGTDAKTMQILSYLTISHIQLPVILLFTVLLESIFAKFWEPDSITQFKYL